MFAKEPGLRSWTLFALSLSAALGLTSSCGARSDIDFLGGGGPGAQGGGGFGAQGGGGFGAFGGGGFGAQGGGGFGAQGGGGFGAQGGGGFGAQGGGGSGGVGGGCPDADMDGYSLCDGDCNDLNPNINPGAFDFINGIDDDCSGGTDDPFVNCDAGLQYTSQDPVDYAKAIDLCQQTTLGATGANKKWGLISAELRLADGTGAPAPQAHSIIQSFGSVLGPRFGQRFAFFSSGLAATPTQPYFQFGTPQGGTDMGTTSPTPPGFPTNKVGCPIPFGNVAFNPVNLKLTVRTPTNAQRVMFDHAFWSAEYPEYACSGFNDLWVGLLTTGAPGIANNKNVIFDNQGTPGSVNLNFFDRCVAGPTGCFGTAGFNFCSGGAGELAGTGYGGADSPCGPPSSIGGGTGWLRTEAPIVPGEVMVIQFIVWDSSDPIFDSSAILDHFRWGTGALPTPLTVRP